MLSYRCKVEASYETQVSLNPWPVSVSEALGMSVNLTDLLGLDKVCLPHGIAGKVTGTIIGKAGKSIELNFARVCVQIGCFL